MEEPRFSRDLKVGFRDRGMGRGDYGIIGQDGALIAEMKDVHHIEGGRPPFEILPVKENALLFAAAPELYDACVQALTALKRTRNKTAVEAIEAALKKAVRPPVTEGAKKKVPRSKRR